jgi:tetratricopeptide (TPR) repeat protein
MVALENLMRAARAAALDERTSPVERGEMLMELAMGLQRRPKTGEHLAAAVTLYDEALALCAGEVLLTARISARQATALLAVPGEGPAPVERARAALEQAIPILGQLGSGNEVAEAEMNLGLCLQHLAGCGRARIADAIAAYQRALRTFDAERHPVEFAILQNNLAAAFLAMPPADEGAKIGEALAVECFERALKVVSLVEHPTEYAMLQNNLGNALQHASSAHAVENRLRAIAAYDEALKVRSAAKAPLEYANTLANKANCLWNLGDVEKARAHYQEAREIFARHGEHEKADIVARLEAEETR